MMKAGCISGEGDSEEEEAAPGPGASGASMAPGSSVKEKNQKSVFGMPLRFGK